MDTKRLLLYICVTAVLLALVIYGILELTAVAPGPTDSATRRLPVGQRQRSPVYLYFIDSSGGQLVSEKRAVNDPGEPVGLAKNIIEALLEGPVSPELINPLPEGTACRALFITEQKVAYVDFSPEISDQHPGGSQAERLSVYAVVNSLIMNVDQIKYVKILINGNEAQTLAGHIDLRFLFSADLRMVK